MSKVTQLSAARCFGGFVKKFSHDSAVTKTSMKFSVFLPPQAEHTKVPALYWLSGLTCNEDNFIQKAGACKYAAKEGIALICPDTSPRGTDIEGEHDGWDFGSGAGFYVNATEEKWKDNYNMYDYVTKELISLAEADLPITNVRSVFGHSMGGHGALICYLKNPGLYKSVSAFAPICNPVNCPWGLKAFSGYLGENKEDWKAYDATELVASAGVKDAILIDQGADDNFYTGKQLLPENFVAACKQAGTPLTYRLQPGYDHSYWFIQSFVEDHITFHAQALKAEESKSN
mmetsp:Transcript_4061/g.7843  ORF Transcript_4061/g.7843 Transcript_4061/m.7843 type:complete len:288 (-) Transcript_4061:194-1057(-)